jgi:hypothetical protein
MSISKRNIVVKYFINHPDRFFSVNDLKKELNLSEYIIRRGIDEISSIGLNLQQKKKILEKPPYHEKQYKLCL